MRNFLEALENRRTVYAIGKEKVVSVDRVEEIVKTAIKHSPSAFNSESTRAILLFDGEHDKFWEMVKDRLREVVPAESFAPTEEKIDSFKAGYGTVVYFDETETTKGLQKSYPLYSDNFPIWAQQSNGMAQLSVWTALEDAGLGASLQHYNELIEDDVREMFNLPESWIIVGQMPFGSPVHPAGEKQFKDIDERVRVFK